MNPMKENNLGITMRNGKTVLLFPCNWIFLFYRENITEFTTLRKEIFAEEIFAFFGQIREVKFRENFFP